MVSVAQIISGFQEDELIIQHLKQSSSGAIVKGFDSVGLKGAQKAKHRLGPKDERVAGHHETWS